MWTLEGELGKGAFPDLELRVLPGWTEGRVAPREGSVLLPPLTLQPQKRLGSFLLFCVLKVLFLAQHNEEMRLLVGRQHTGSLGLPWRNCQGTSLAAPPTEAGPGQGRPGLSGRAGQQECGSG